MSSSQHGAIDTVRLSDRDRRRLVDQIDQQASQATPPQDHRNLRVSLAHASMDVRVAHPDGDPVRYRVVPRNLSARGVAFIHGAFIYPGSVCQITLPRRDRSLTELPGRVTRCRHLKGLYHEVGVVFDHPIELSQFVGLTPEQASRNRKESGFESGMIVVAFFGPNGNPSKLAVMPMMLHEHGLSFRHGAPIPDDAPCIVGLPRHDGSPLKVPGRCVGMVTVEDGQHDISIQFEAPVDLRLIRRGACPAAADTDAQGPWADDADAPAQPLAGLQLLLVDDSAPDRQLLSIHLKRRGALISEAGTVREALQRVQEGDVQAVLVDTFLGNEDGCELARQLRARSFTGLMVAMSADDSPAMRRRSLDAGFAALLVKPFTAEQFEQVLTPLLTFSDAAAGSPGSAADTPEAPLHSTLVDDPEVMPLVERYIAAAKAQCQRLEQAIVDHDWAVMQNICRQLKGSSAGYGFEPVSSLAGQALRTCASAQPADATELVRQLIGLLQRMEA